MNQGKPPYSIPYPRFRVRRTLMRLLTRALLRLLTRVKIEGLENIPDEGPVILAGNHVAVLEAVLMTVIPKRLVEPIGAGDMPFEGIFDKIVTYYGYIPINRGNLDRKGMNQALDVLKQGGMVGIFPEGGVLVFACAHDKRHAQMALSLARGFSEVIVTKPGTFKQSDPSAVEASFRAAGFRTELVADTAEALEEGRRRSVESGKPFLVLGSFYLAAEAAKLFDVP